MAQVRQRERNLTQSCERDSPRSSHNLRFSAVLRTMPQSVGLSSNTEVCTKIILFPCVLLLLAALEGTLQVLQSLPTDFQENKFTFFFFLICFSLFSEALAKIPMKVAVRLR